MRSVSDGANFAAPPSSRCCDALSVVVVSEKCLWWTLKANPSCGGGGSGVLVDYLCTVDLCSCASGFSEDVPFLIMKVIYKEDNDLM